MDKIQLRKRIKKFVDEAGEKQLQMIYKMFEVEKEYDWWDELPKEIQEEIDLSIQQVQRGKTIPHEEVMKKYAKWLKR
jgi:hypothetical protein